MSKISYLFAALIFLSCTNDPKPISNTTIKPFEAKTPIFTDCFAGIDTTAAGISISCSGDLFTVINDHYVIRIHPDLGIFLDSCYTLSIGKWNEGMVTELFIYDNQDAKQAQFCSDIGLIGAPKPSRIVRAQDGQLIVRVSDPIELNGNRQHHTTVLIKKLVFKDSKTGKNIVFENELLWKVLDLGTPG